MSDPTGRFLWYELLTTDPGGGIEFYRDAIGWETQEWEGGERPYTMFAADGQPVAGVMELPKEAREQGAPPHWLAYIGTRDVDAACARAEALGGRRLWGPLDVPGIGRMAGLADPQGAVLAVYAPESSPGAEEPPSEGRFSWHELATSDRDAAWDFYSEMFGWEKTDAFDMGEGNLYQMYGRPGGIPVGGIFNKPPEMPASFWLFYTMVEDVNAVVDAVRDGGGKVLNGPMEVPGGDLVAQCTDPHGAAFALHQRAREAE